MQRKYGQTTQRLQLNTTLTGRESLSLSTFLKILIKVIIKSVDQMAL